MAKRTKKTSASLNINPYHEKKSINFQTAQDQIEWFQLPKHWEKIIKDKTVFHVPVHYDTVRLT